jgi:flagellar motor switch protein FliN
MVNQATALLIETGKARRETSHALRGFHRGESRDPADDVIENDLGDAEQLDLRIELGRTRLAPEDVQALRKGAVLLLDERIGEPAAIFVGTRLVGRGEIVVVDGKIGVRVVELTE